jgi:predicted O-methyltransferase YrrM
MSSQSTMQTSATAADHVPGGLTAISRASFMEPEWYPPSCWIQHAPFVYWLVTTQRPRTFAELGSHYGFSFFAVCQAVVAYRLPTQCTAIDAWKGDEHAGFYRDEVYNLVKARAEARYPGFTTLKRMYFDEALRDFDDASIDLLHIDGRHFYDDARHDFETWLPKVRPGGVVMFHDTQVRDRGFGVHQLWAEVAVRYPSFEFVHGNGLGVIALGTPPAGLAEFFAAGRDATATRDIRFAYERLGGSLEAVAHRRRQAFKTKWSARAKRKVRNALYGLGLASTGAEFLDPTA